MAAPGRSDTTPLATFDSIILAAVLAECRDLAGAGVARAQQAGPNEIGLALRWRGRRRALLISAHPRWGRIHVVPELAPAEAGPFVRLLRGRLEGSMLRSLDAPPFERLVVMTFETLEGPHDLIVEIMGRHANMFLCRDETVIGALKLVGTDRARARDVLPGRPYVRPTRPRTDPSTVTANDLLSAARAPRAAGPRAGWRAVLEATGGIGPALAWEACLRAGVDPRSPLCPDAAGRIVDVLRAIGQATLAQKFFPTLYRDRDGQPVAYAAFPMQCFADLRPEPSSMSSAVDAVAARAVAATASQSLRTGLASIVQQAKARTARALAAASDDARAAEEADRLRQQGELILAYLRQVAPGQRTLEVPGFEGQTVSIALDPRLSGVENAQAYFKRYARAAAARTRLPDRLAALEADRAFLEEMATAVAVAETVDDLWVVEQDLVAAGLRRKALPSARPRVVDAARAFDLPGGFRIRAGRSARENERLTFEVAGPDDLWLHARGMPGAHVVVTGRDPGEDVIAIAAAVAAYYSAGRQAARVPVDVTRRREVRRVRGGRPGQVTYAGERTLQVVPGLPGARGRNR